MSVKSPLGRIVKVRTSDEIELDGFLVVPSASRGVAVIHVHGMYENAYLPLFINPLMRRLSGDGFPVVSANTRAQDYIYRHRRWTTFDKFSWVRNGGAYEVFSNCLLDLKAWIDFCVADLGVGRVLVTGHSHGALKAAFLASREYGLSELAGVGLLSPSDDIELQKSGLKGRYNEALMLAEKMVNDGAGDEFMPDWTYSSPMSAIMYVDMFGHDSDLALFSYRYPNRDRALGAITTPVLVVFGENDIATAGVSSVEALSICRGDMANASSFEAAVVNGADHHYCTKEEILAAIVADLAVKIVSM